ncbi:MAG: WbqC family protein [Verrucomicrobiaceae bacterium]|nr:WbqC family protein [Verrucomicrobiaceae bacterium]
MKTVVISQPMYFPWVGQFEQLAMADVFVFLDHVQFARGFINRVQYKTAHGQQWLTIPLQKHPRSTPICELAASGDEWREEHVQTFIHAVKKAPFAADAIDIMNNVLSRKDISFSQLVESSVLAVRDYFQLSPACTFHRSSQIPVQTRKSDLIKQLVLHFGGTRYVTGMGALNYLDHEDFENAGIHVEYMNYRKEDYPQLHPPFTPFVTTLDLVANMGRAGGEKIISGTIPWREAVALHRHEKKANAEYPHDEST